MAHHKLIAVLLSAVLFIGTAGCGTVPLTGRKQLRLLSDAQMSALAQESYLSFLQKVTLSSSGKHSRQVAAMGEKLVKAANRYLKKHDPGNNMAGALQWEFKVVADSQVNAFCLPNGKIVVYEGILQYASDPDYMAVVISHEIAHALARHGNERMSQQLALNAAGSLVTTVLKIDPGLSRTQAAFQLAFGLGSRLGIVLPYSRTHEYEADRIGLYLMAMAGYRLEKAPKFWEKMMASQHAAGVPQFLSTHPSDKNRIAKLRAAIEDAKKYK